MPERIACSRTLQLIFETFYVTLSLVACVGSVGFFQMKFTGDFYTYFTNLSCYLCAGIMVAELVQTARKKEDSYVSALPVLRFISIPGLIVTFLVFNLLLAGDPARDPALNFQVECILCHIVLPILYLIDWILFYEHGRVRRTWPLLAAALPAAYLAFVFVHAAVRGFDASVMNYAGTDPVIYPYFFLNPDRVGLSGILLWSCGLLVAFVGIGGILMGVDRLLGRRKACSQDITKGGIAPF